MKRFAVLSLLSLIGAAVVYAQATAKPAVRKPGLDETKEIRLGEDEVGCKDSPLVARLTRCSIIQCDQRETDSLEVQVGATPEGSPQREAMDGASEVIYYLCPAALSPASIVKQLENSLSKLGYKTVFNGKDSDEQPLVTVLKDTQWIQVSTYLYNQYSAYVLTTVKVSAESQTEQTAELLAEEIQKNGRVALYGIEFGADGVTLAPDAEKTLAPVAAFLVRQPAWRVRVEGHLAQGTQELSQKRAASVASWLLDHGIDKSRLSIQGFGDAKPVGESASDKLKNERIEIVRF